MNKSILKSDINEDDRNKKHSQVEYNIVLPEKGCNACDFDSLTLISTNQDMFNRFLNTEHIFQKAIFNFLKQIVQIK